MKRKAKKPNQINQLLRGLTAEQRCGTLMVRGGQTDENFSSDPRGGRVESCKHLWLSAETPKTNLQEPGPTARGNLRISCMRSEGPSSYKDADRLPSCVLCLLPEAKERKIFCCGISQSFLLNPYLPDKNWEGKRQWLAWWKQRNLLLCGGSGCASYGYHRMLLRGPHVVCMAGRSCRKPF